MRGDILLLKEVQLFGDDIEFHEELTVFLVRTTPVERPAWGDDVFVERAKDGLFDLIRDGHVVLNGVQRSQYEVKYANLVNFKIRSSSTYRRFDHWEGSSVLAPHATWVAAARKEKLTARARSPSSSLMTAEKLLEVMSRKSQHLLIDRLSHPDVGCS